ncbi:MULTISPECIES: LptA/OstA family protein [Novosphingobium]|jgi:lipopolysaccharide export system protein LptA|uniref:Lipopolysaccharide export system protein LptA n=1 Tax=Novosphingobium panipatense TaxID=428991 RepID=A0ABY1QCR6_9SPHN|nr:MULTISPECIES: LptA/OstA family protein [Novosphingobium]SMP67169.1 lipopolysaccharide export system protein LptA [Novosphingobium panipatense]
MTASKTLPRIAIALPALALAALAGSQQLGAQVFSGHNSNAPVDYAADRIELQDRQDRVILSGNVDVKQADLRLRAARTVVNFTNQGSMQIQRITASGGVTVSRPNETATGDVGIYDFNQKIITMTGNATIKRSNGDVLRGGRLVVDLNSGVSTASAGPGGRVSGTFSVPKQGGN